MKTLTNKAEIAEELSKVAVVPVQVTPELSILICDIGSTKRTEWTQTWLLELVAGSGISPEALEDAAGDQEELLKLVMSRVDISALLSAMNRRDAKLIYWAVCDEGGRPIFNEEDPEDVRIVEYMFRDEAAQKLVLDAIKAHNVLRDSDVVEAKKGSPSSPKNKRGKG